MSDGFADILWARVDGPARSWLERAWPAVDEGLTSVRFRAAFAGLGRRLREYQLGDEDVRSLADAGVIGIVYYGSGYRHRRFLENPDRFRVLLGELCPESSFLGVACLGKWQH